MRRLGTQVVIRAVLRRPGLVWEIMKSGLSMRRRGRLFPSAAYVSWRLQTAYGARGSGFTSDDLVHYLEWRRQMRRIRVWETSR